MFYDDTKRTMVSIELLSLEERQGKSFAEFKRAQKKLVDELRALITRHHRETELRVDPTPIATDVENVRVGKALGAGKFVEFLNERALEPQEYVGFGDSESDFAMHEELQRLGEKSRFVFVGGREDSSGESEEGVIVTNQHGDKGTLDFLKNERN